MKFFLTMAVAMIANNILAQDYKSLLQKGDSLYHAKKYDSALYTFEDAINLLRKSNTVISDDEWTLLLMGAGNAASARSNFEVARKYWNLAKGNRGETIDDKVNYLKTSGVKEIFSISKVGGGGLARINLGECSSLNNFYLFWIQGANLYVQKFNDCNSYRPLILEESSIKDLISGDGIENMNAETIGNVNNFGHHSPEYDILFYNNSTADKIHIRQLDFMDPTKSKPKDPKTSRGEAVKNYTQNISTSIYQLLKASLSNISKYEAVINSPSSRLRSLDR